MPIWILHGNNLGKPTWETWETYVRVDAHMGQIWEQSGQSHVETYVNAYIPTCLVDYIERLYGRLQGYVTGPFGESETFNFQKGVFQGDPLSPVIFLACFNPLLEYLTSIKTKHGYDLNGDKVISTPYADDFNLISNNKRNHQKNHIPTQLTLSVHGSIPKACQMPKFVDL